MIVGVCTVELRLPTAGSLKDKRRIVKSLTSQVRNKFNVSIAEVGYQDVWGTAELGVTCVSTDSGHAHAMLSEVVKLIEDSRLDFILTHYSIEIW